MKRYGPIASEVLLWVTVFVVLFIPDDLPPPQRAVALVIVGALTIAFVPLAVQSVRELVRERR